MINIQHNIYNMEKNHSKIRVSQCYYTMAGKCKFTKVVKGPYLA